MTVMINTEVLQRWLGQHFSFLSHLLKGETNEKNNL